MSIEKKISLHNSLPLYQAFTCMLKTNSKIIIKDFIPFPPFYLIFYREIQFIPLVQVTHFETKKKGGYIVLQNILTNKTIFNSCMIL